jgi:hypothetical protein
VLVLLASPCYSWQLASEEPLKTLDKFANHCRPLHPKSDFGSEGWGFESLRARQLNQAFFSFAARLKNSHVRTMYAAKQVWSVSIVVVVWY